MGIDGVSVTGAGGFPSPFYGTSAAAPHVAGIAALVIEAQRRADPSLTKREVADSVAQKLKDTAIDLGEQVDDYSKVFGYGRADALAAVASIEQIPATFTVNSTGDGADSDTNDGNCDDGNGNCTLRAAIQQANADDGGVIKFNITGVGIKSIHLASALPAITEPVFIDGYSQPGAGPGTVLIELDGTNAGTNVNGLKLTGQGSYVRGLAINLFDGNGIVLEGLGRQVIEGNRIGTNTAGTTDQGNGRAGVYINDAPSVILRSNVISGNDSHGVSISGNQADEAVIDGNMIGTNATGTTELGNTMSGVRVSGSDGTRIIKNVISGNDSHGVSLSGSGTKNTLVAENYIGTNESGTALANSGSGVHIGDGSSKNLVEGNTIANNTGDGLTVVSSSATGNSIWENSIHSNGGLGIDLADDGVTANDAGDSDSGPIHCRTSLF